MWSIWWITKQWKRLESIAYKIMLAAEKAVNTADGQAKFNFAFNEVYQLLPAWFRVFVSEQSLREKLQEWYDDMKDDLEKNYCGSSCGTCGNDWSNAT